MEDVGQVLLGILPQQVQGVSDVVGEGGGRGGVQQGVQHPQPLLGQLLLLSQEAAPNDFKISNL